MSKIPPNNLHLYVKNDFIELNPELRNQKSFVIQCLQKNGLLYECLSSELQSDKEIIMTAIKQDEGVFDSIPDFLKNDLDFLVEIIRVHPLLIDKLDVFFRNNKKLILVAINEVGVDALWHKDKHVYEDLEIMTAALKSPYGQDCWDPILCSAGQDAEFSKKMIEIAFRIFGDEILRQDFQWIFSRQEVRNELLKSHPQLISFLQ